MAAGLNSKRLHGTTLVELMVSAALFLLLISAIMSFYISGAKVTNQQEQRLEMVRRSLRLLDRLEVQLAYARIIWLGTVGDTANPEQQTESNASSNASTKVQESNSNQGDSSTQGSNSTQVILFAPLASTTHNPADGAPWDSRAAKIYVVESDGAGPQVFYCDGQGQTRLLGSLFAGETIQFSQQAGVLKVKLTLNFYPNGQEAPKEQRYVQERAIPLHNHLHY